MIIKCPHKLSPYKLLPYKKTVFLAGSIEQGKAEDWQEKLSKEIDADDIAIFNPRRDNWDSSWDNSKDNPMFNEQVNWELDYINHSKLIVFYFAKNTISPITLLELGLTLGQLEYSNQRIIIYCDKEYCRRGNVEITFDRYRYSDYYGKYTTDYDEFLNYIKEELK